MPPASEKDIHDIASALPGAERTGEPGRAIYQVRTEAWLSRAPKRLAAAWLADQS